MHGKSFLGLTLSGCGLYGPSYTKPEVTAPNSWRSVDNLAGVGNIKNLPDLAWWTKFNDPDYFFKSQKH